MLFQEVGVHGIGLRGKVAQAQFIFYPKYRLANRDKREQALAFLVLEVLLIELLIASVFLLLFPVLVGGHAFGARSVLEHSPPGQVMGGEGIIV